MLSTWPAQLKSKRNYAHVCLKQPKRTQRHSVFFADSAQMSTLAKAKQQKQACRLSSTLTLMSGMECA
jgi:hypothetical protein